MTAPEGQKEKDATMRYDWEREEHPSYGGVDESSMADPDLETDISSEKTEARDCNF